MNAPLGKLPPMKKQPANMTAPFAILVNDFIASNRQLSGAFSTVNGILAAMFEVVRQPDEWGSQGQRGYFHFVWNGACKPGGWPEWSVTMTVHPEGSVSLDAQRGKKPGQYENTKTSVMGLPLAQICAIARILIEDMDKNAKAGVQ